MNEALWSMAGLEKGIWHDGNVVVISQKEKHFSKVDSATGL